MKRSPNALLGAVLCSLPLVVGASLPASAGGASYDEMRAIEEKPKNRYDGVRSLFDRKRQEDRQMRQQVGEVERLTLGDVLKIMEQNEIVVYGGHKITIDYAERFRERYERAKAAHESSGKKTGVAFPSFLDFIGMQLTNQ